MKELPHAHCSECSTRRLKQTIPLGTSEVYGKEARNRDGVMDIIRGVYELHGFEPLHTPVLENSVVFNGHHGEGEKLLFCLHDSKKNSLVLRYDLTVPLARFVTANPDIPRPLKRFQMAPVFRDDEVDLGHFREFTQCDGDVVGASSLTADAEILSLAHDGLTKLGFKNFTLRVNHRAIIRGIAAKSGINTPDGVLQVQRALDFADKVIKDGIKGVERDLRKRGISENVIENIISVIDMPGDPAKALTKLSQILSGQEQALKGLHELEEIIGYLDPQVADRVAIDLTLARGADYYTGFVLEGVVKDVPVGAVLGGGRYDNLVSAFSSSPEPAVGMAFGLERILTAMKMMEMSHASSNERVLVVPLHKDHGATALYVARSLRKDGIHTDLCAEMPDIESARKYASSRNFNVLVFYSEDGVQVENLWSSSELAEKVCKLVNA